MEDLLKEILKEVRNLSYLFFAFGIIWLFLFGYMYSISRRQNALRRELDEIKRQRGEAEQEDGE